MQNPNSYQVGGTHYQGTYQHWDLVLRCGLGYLEGNATKYVVRWRKSGKGEQDLRKALHYVDKLSDSFNMISHWGRRSLHWVRQDVTAFCEGNCIPNIDAVIIMQLATWESPSDLEVVRNNLWHLIAESRTQIPAPLTDSNKHAERQ